MEGFWKGKRVLELGSGLGHLGWGLYQMGAHVTCTDTPLGDLDSLRKRVDKWLEDEVRAGSRVHNTHTHTTFSPVQTMILSGKTYA